MNRSWNTPRLGLIVCLLLLAVCVAADRNPKREVKTLSPRLKLTEYTLPYQGYGEVDILDDATIVVQLGGELVGNLETDDDADIWIAPIEEFAFRMNPVGLSLVEHQGGVLLDRGGTQDRARRVAVGLGNVVPFRVPAPNDVPVTPIALASFSGPMSLGYDAAGRLVLSITDAEEPARTFTFRPTYGSGEAMGADGAPVQKPGDDTVILMGEGPPIGWTAGCSANCSGGSCSISCTNQGASCYCKGSTPVCRCVKVY